MKKKTVYLVFSCDTWKTKIMDLLMATTSTRRLKMFLSELIELGEASYDPIHFVMCRHPRDLAREFRQDFDSFPKEELNQINARLKYVYVECALDGEEL